jgi:hypothetical protein
VPMTKAELDADFDALQSVTAELRAEHEDIESRPVNIAEHERHRARLRAHIDALHRHIEDVKAVRGGE